MSYGRAYLAAHMKKHRGETCCPVCQQEFAAMSCMRRHMVKRHGMSQQTVDRVTNKRHQGSGQWKRRHSGAAARAGEAPAPTASAATSATITESAATSVSGAL